MLALKIGGFMMAASAVALAFFRGMFWAAGADWSVPQAGAVVSVFFGIVAGIFWGVQKYVD